MVAKPTTLTHKVAIELQLVVECFTICCYRSRRPVRKLLDTPSYAVVKLLLSSPEHEAKLHAFQTSNVIADG
jgi:hypothetical protein